MTLVIICGATASGKSDAAVELAKRIGGEIINADSMQIYRGMDIGTAKLTIEERQGIPHHLLDVISVNEDATVAWYQQLAREKVAEIESRGKVAIVVGGTGLYIKSIVDELNFPETDPEVRANLEAEAETFGLAALFEKLQSLDPQAASNIDRANARRVIRALEVITITGKPFSASLPREDSELYPSAFHFGMAADREVLRERVSERVDRMWSLGFVDEVKKLVEIGIRRGVTAQKAIGYAQILSVLDGNISEADAVEDTKRATRQYIRRQETWFNRDERIQWIAPGVNRVDEMVKRINS